MNQTIADLVVHAYNSGILPYNGMTIGTLSIELTLFRFHNMLTLRKNGKLMSMSVYESDSLELQESSIQSFVLEFLA